MKPVLIDSEEVFKEMMKDPSFVKALEENEPQYQLERSMILARMEKKMSQRDLAKKMKSTQAVISRIESGSVSPSLRTMGRIAAVFGKKLEVRFVAKSS